MHQTIMALFVLLWFITDIHVATGTCMACAISGTVTGSHKYPTDCTKSAPVDELF